MRKFTIIKSPMNIKNVGKALSMNNLLNFGEFILVRNTGNVKECGKTFHRGLRFAQQHSIHTGEKLSEYK